MTTEQSAFPLSWPNGRPRTPRYQVKASAFGKHTLAEARDEVLRELALLRATRIIISSNVPLRRDGMMSGTSAAIAEAGVAVYFRLKEKAMVMACDRWTKVEHNLWAIACTIGAQRGVTRWGAVEIEQAFAGYAALPPPTSDPNNCWAVLGLPFGASADQINERYRQLSQKVHPDRGGTHDAMATLNNAREEALSAIKGQP